MLQEFPIKNNIASSLLLSLNEIKALFEDVYGRLNNVWK